MSRVLERMNELDRRKRAAAKTAEDMRIANRRAMWREGNRRKRMKAKDVQTRSTGQKQCEPENDLKYKELFGPAEPKIEPKPENEIRQSLVKLSKDMRAPASARVTAMRTLAEMDGLVGKLQTQANDTSDQPLSTLTREQLENELTRLRANVARKPS